MTGAQDVTKCFGTPVASKPRCAVPTAAQLPADCGWMDWCALVLSDLEHSDTLSAHQFVLRRWQDRRCNSGSCSVIDCGKSSL
jgi:hypothetical protein